MPGGHDGDDDDKDDNDGNDGGDGVLMPAEKALQSKILGSSCMAVMLMIDHDCNNVFLRISCNIGCV